MSCNYSVYTMLIEFPVLIFRKAFAQATLDRSDAKRRHRKGGALMTS